MTYDILLVKFRNFTHHGAYCHSIYLRSAILICICSCPKFLFCPEDPVRISLKKWTFDELKPCWTFWCNVVNVHKFVANSKFCEKELPNIWHHFLQMVIGCSGRRCDWARAVEIPARVFAPHWWQAADCHQLLRAVPRRMQESEVRLGLELRHRSNFRNSERTR